jgi:hypothetical protein
MPNRHPSSRSQNINLDGSVFGTALPHVFLTHFPTAVVLPPKVYYYQPKIFGFPIFGKRGSKWSTAGKVLGGVRLTDEDPKPPMQK